LLAAIASFWEALQLDVVKEGLLFLSIDIPKAEIIFVTGDHLSVFLLLRAEEAVPIRLRLTAGLPTISRKQIRFTGIA
jgi:hypothetical protein